MLIAYGFSISFFVPVIYLLIALPAVTLATLMISLPIREGRDWRMARQNVSLCALPFSLVNLVLTIFLMGFPLRNADRQPMSLVDRLWLGLVVVPPPVIVYFLMTRRRGK